MSEKKDEKNEEPTIRSKISSAFTRHVGNLRIDVVNTRQNPVSKKADKQKWAVIVTNGKKVKLHSGHAKKSDAIASLRAHEIVLKAADKSE